jgi:hypothetical protein
LTTGAGACGAAAARCIGLPPACHCAAQPTTTAHSYYRSCLQALELAHRLLNFKAPSTGTHLFLPCERLKDKLGGE